MDGLRTLGVREPDLRDAEFAVRVNKRKSGVSVSEYLAARSIAGTTAECIVEGCVKVAGDEVVSRFFETYPEPKVDLGKWLQGWISKGCSAVGTLNTQNMYGADWWHHQQVFGEHAEMEDIKPGLISDSVLQIRRDDAMSCTPFDAERCDSLGPEWEKMKVSQQLQDMKSGKSNAKHIFIPASYRAGITIFAKKGTPAAEELLTAKELPTREHNHSNGHGMNP
eukprot:gnl/MRDRNA2_/MRDRNA2_110181_c0_seq1.p1 gnl/MRDRNA2_/MRDRNA2_110181_c0~~gnl/MRDRNA2_/MRDRNA2_110181_c0_seq1.p1  ORF type:complete len:258 (-),score=37.51 gnl/MRDRNA2_/MRDRNA2_110181_c0_seq1:8-676(-)